LAEEAQCTEVREEVQVQVLQVSQTLMHQLVVRQVHILRVVEELLGQVHLRLREQAEHQGVQVQDVVTVVVVEVVLYLVVELVRMVPTEEMAVIPVVVEVVEDLQ
jgi:hypothetical protein